MHDNSHDKEVLLLRRKLHLLLRTGKLLIENGADTNRVEENMMRMAAYMDIPEDKIHIDISWSMLIINVSDERHSFSKFQKCTKHVINMNVISQMSQLSWRAIDEDFSLDRLEEKLDRVEQKPSNYPKLLVAICAGLACGGFCKLFGCDWISFFFASAAAFVGFKFRSLCIEQFSLNSYISILVATCVATGIAFLSSYTGLSATPYHPLLACALFVIPGVPLINFVDDMIDNHLLVGITRAANALMMIGSMTFGIAFALRILVINDVEIDQKFSELSMIPHDTYLAYAIAAAIAATGFSMMFNIQRRFLWVIAVGGMVAVCTRNFVNFELGYGPVIGSFMGSFVVSLLTIPISNKFKVPRHVLSIPSVIPMIPGVLMYRSILAFISLDGVVGEVTKAFTNGINSVLIVICISLGVAIPNIVARKSISRNKKLSLERKLEDRRRRGVFNEWYNVIY